MSQTGRTVLFVSHNMQALSQLCDRAIWLEQGEVHQDGPSGDVVARYLQSGFGAGSSRDWPDPEAAPGDDLVRLRSLRVLQRGEEAPAVDVREPVAIEIVFTMLRPGEVFPKLKVFDAEGQTAFNAMDTDRRWQHTTLPGEYVATAWIPGNYLNEGLTTVWAEICSLAAPKLYPHAGADVAFHVQDPAEGDSARGQFTGQWKGVVRPLLEWTAEEPDPDAQLSANRVGASSSSIEPENR
jgi:lipopolysaccharide transport system ATP-binding protein